MAVSTAELLNFITSQKHLAELYESVGSGYCLKAQCQPVHRFSSIFNQMMSKELLKQFFWFFFCTSFFFLRNHSKECPLCQLAVPNSPLSFQCSWLHSDILTTKKIQCSFSPFISRLETKQISIPTLKSEHEFLASSVIIFHQL